MRRLFPSPPDGLHRRLPPSAIRPAAAAAFSPATATGHAGTICPSRSSWVARARPTAIGRRRVISGRRLRLGDDGTIRAGNRLPHRGRRLDRDGRFGGYHGRLVLTNHVGAFAAMLERLGLDDAGSQRRQAANFKFGHADTIQGQGWDHSPTPGHRARPALRRSAPVLRTPSPWPRLPRRQNRLRPRTRLGNDCRVGQPISRLFDATATLTGSSTGAAAGTTSGTGDFATTTGTTTAGRCLVGGRWSQGGRSVGIAGNVRSRLDGTEEAQRRGLGRGGCRWRCNSLACIDLCGVSTNAVGRAIRSHCRGSLRLRKKSPTKTSISGQLKSVRRRNIPRLHP